MWVWVAAVVLALACGLAYVNPDAAITGLLLVSPIAALVLIVVGTARALPRIVRGRRRRAF